MHCNIQVRRTAVCFCRKIWNGTAFILPLMTAVITSSNIHGDIIKVGGFITPLFSWHVLILQPQRRCTLQPRPMGEQGKDKLLVVQQWFIMWCIYPAREKPGARRPAAWRVLHSTLAFWLVQRHQRAIHGQRWLISRHVERPSVKPLQCQESVQQGYLGWAHYCIRFT